MNASTSSMSVHESLFRRIERLPSDWPFAARTSKSADQRPEGAGSRPTRMEMFTRVRAAAAAGDVPSCFSTLAAKSVGLGHDSEPTPGTHSNQGGFGLSGCASAVAGADQHITDAKTKSTQPQFVASLAGDRPAAPLSGANTEFAQRRRITHRRLASPDMRGQ